VIDRMMGGLIPMVRAGRDRHTVQTTWWVEVTWLRCQIRVEVVW
jgi:hypothetical protein